jgi:hypothetical protein
MKALNILATAWPAQLPHDLRVGVQLGPMLEMVVGQRNEPGCARSPVSPEPWRQDRLGMFHHSCDFPQSATVCAGADDITVRRRVGSWAHCGDSHPFSQFS